MNQEKNTTNTTQDLPDVEPEEVIQPVLPTPEEIELEALKNGRMIQEAEQIPLEHVEPYEAYLLQKYQNQDTLTEKEYEDLNKTLTRYRPALNKIQPDTILENYEDNIEFQNSKDEFLYLSEHYNDIETIRINYPFSNGLTKEYIFDVYPLVDTQAILSIRENLSLFKDFTDKEMDTFVKGSSEQTLTPEEQVIWQGVQEKIDRVASKNENQILTEYLAMCLKFHEEDNTREEMLQVFQHMKPLYVKALYMMVQEKQKVTGESIEKVFPDSSN